MLLSVLAGRPNSQLQPKSLDLTPSAPEPSSSSPSLGLQEQTVVPGHLAEVGPTEPAGIPCRHERPDHRQQDPAVERTHRAPGLETGGTRAPQRTKGGSCTAEATAFWVTTTHGAEVFLGVTGRWFLVGRWVSLKMRGRSQTPGMPVGLHHVDRGTPTEFFVPSPSANLTLLQPSI